MVSAIITNLYKINIKWKLGGSSLRSWQLTHELTSLQTGVNTIDDDLTYLYGQLPDKIRTAAVDVMTKKMRRVITDISVAALNFFGYFFT